MPAPEMCHTHTHTCRNTHIYDGSAPANSRLLPFSGVAASSSILPCLAAGVFVLGVFSALGKGVVFARTRFDGAFGVLSGPWKDSEALLSVSAAITVLSSSRLAAAALIAAWAT